jgi:hypothetical protein
MNRIRILPLIALVALAACNGLPGDPDPVDVAYQADRHAYTPQDSIATTLVNTSNADVGYNLCTSTLESRSGGGWTRVERTPEHPCALVLFVLAAGESAAWREPATAVPGPGTYRLRTGIETPVSGRRIDVVTEPFTVR